MSNKNFKPGDVVILDPDHGPNSSTSPYGTAHQLKQAGSPYKVVCEKDAHGCITVEGANGQRVEAFSARFKLAQPELRLKVGGLYRTRNGQRMVKITGPNLGGRFNRAYPFLGEYTDNGNPQAWMENGHYYESGGEYAFDLVEEVSAPAAPVEGSFIVASTRPTGRLELAASPKVHATREAAEKEALRLAELRPGWHFRVYSFDYLSSAYADKPAKPVAKLTKVA